MDHRQQLRNLSVSLCFPQVSLNHTIQLDNEGQTTAFSLSLQNIHHV